MQSTRSAYVEPPLVASPTGGKMPPTDSSTCRTGRRTEPPRRQLDHEGATIPEPPRQLGRQIARATMYSGCTLLGEWHVQTRPRDPWERRARRTTCRPMQRIGLVAALAAV